MKMYARLMIVLLALACHEPALAGKDQVDSETARALVAKGELMPLDEILRLNEALIDGRVIEIELERKAGGYVYEIKVLRRDGRKIELKFDGRSGELRGKGK